MYTKEDLEGKCIDLDTVRLLMSGCRYEEITYVHTNPQKMAKYFKLSGVWFIVNPTASLDSSYRGLKWTLRQVTDEDTLAQLYMTEIGKTSEP